MFNTCVESPRFFPIPVLAVVISFLFFRRTLPKVMALRYDEADKLCEEAKGQTLTSPSMNFVVDGDI